MPQLIGLVLLVLVVFLIAGLVTGNLFYVVKQQHAVIIERLGKFHRIVGAGFHAKIPFVDRKAATVSLRTMKNGFNIDVKTEDNVTIGLEVSAQYHVSYDRGDSPQQSGVWRSYYMLQQPVAQMRDFIEQMAAYGFTLVSTLITKIALPAEVEDSMNQINAAQRTKAAAQDLAEADRIRRVTEAVAEAEAMEKAGEGIANQRKAIAAGISDSLATIQETGVSAAEANQLFMFTQWTEMMSEFAKAGKASTVVLPSDFTQTAGVFEQMVTAQSAGRDAAVPPTPPRQ